MLDEFGLTILLIPSYGVVDGWVVLKITIEGEWDLVVLIEDLYN
jgi:hypothetical protein